MSSKPDVNLLRLYLERLREAILYERNNDVKLSFELVELPFLIGAILVAALIALVVAGLILSAVASATVNTGGASRAAYMLQGGVAHVPMRVVKIVKMEYGGMPALLSALTSIYLIASPLSLALGVWEAYAVYKLVAREIDHRRRTSKVYQTVYDILSALKYEEAKLMLLRDAIDDAKEAIPERTPGLWAILYFIFNIVVFYIFHFLNRDLVKHEKVEKRVYELVYEAVGAELPAAAKPAILEEPATPERPTILYIILSLLTLGIFIAYWVHVVNSDWNAHIEVHEKSERWLLDVLEKMTSKLDTGAS